MSKELWGILGTLIGALLGFTLKYFSDRISHKELFDHRLRLEKEYGIYTQLWEKLFDLRKAAGRLVTGLHELPEEEDPYETFIKTFNPYQKVVRRNEPFIHPTIYNSARRIASLGHEISGETMKKNRFLNRRSRQVNVKLDDKSDDNSVEKILETNNALEKLFDQVEMLAGKVCEAIRKRIVVNP